METRDLTRERQTGMGNLEKVRRSLRQEDENLEEKLVEYRRNLDTVFPTTLDTRKPAAKYLQMSLQLLEEQPCYRKWWQNDKGCLLLISGITVPEGQKQACGYSWLSPAASDLTERIRRDEGLVAFFNCHPTFELQPDEEPLVTEVVASLLFQILKSQPQILREDYERRSGNLQIEAWSRPKVKDTLEVMLGSAIDILQGISDKCWTYFIIDRADRCKIRLLRLLEWLHKVVSHPGCRVKVFVVWDSNHSNMDPQDWESFEETANGRIYSKLRWYQDRRQPFDKSPLRTPLIRFESNESQHSRSFE